MTAPAASVSVWCLARHGLLLGLLCAAVSISDSAADFCAVQVSQSWLIIIC